MEKSLSPTRAKRIMRVFKRLVDGLEEAGLSRQLIGDDSFSGDSIVLDGHRVLNFGLCSYLALGDDPRVKRAAKEAIDAFGSSYSSSIAYTAVPLYRDLRDRMSQIFDADVIVTGTTTLGHLSALPVLVMPDDHVLVDTQTHSSVLMATQTLQATGIPVTPIPHNDMDALERAIASDNESSHIWYLTDGVFSMQGDTSPAEELTGLLDRHDNLHLYVDDAHGFGWAGTNGRGQYLDRVGWHERSVVIVGLAKAFGSLGGVIATQNEEFAENISMCGPTLTFGGPIPPASLGASIASADIFLSDEILERQQALSQRIRLVNDLSAEMGLEFASVEETPLWFYDIGSVNEMLRFGSAMRDAGFYLNGSGFPAVPHGHAGVRFTVTLDLSPEQIEDMLTCFNEKRLELFGETEIVVDLNEAETQPEQVESRQAD